jgi:hypothetical protein
VTVRVSFARPIVAQAHVLDWANCKTNSAFCNGRRPPRITCSELDANGGRTHSRNDSVVVSSDLSQELYVLLDEKLDTFEKLELVLALREAGQPQTVGELALQLQVGNEALQRVVDAVAAAGVVQMLDGDRVRFTSGAWDSALDEAARIHASEPGRFVSVFTRIAMERIRSMAARTFADAFRIRKKKD